MKEEFSQKIIGSINLIFDPEDKKKLQPLFGKINFIIRFISNLSGKIQPFSPLLKLEADQEFVWRKEQ